MKALGCGIITGAGFCLYIGAITAAGIGLMIAGFVLFLSLKK